MTGQGFAADLLAGQVAVVTGGASGLGRETALRLGAAGASAVVVADIRADPREGGVPTAELLQQRGVRAEFVTCDVTSVADAENAVNVASRYGAVTIMVTAAGILRQEDALAVTEAAYDRMMDINVKGTFFAAQAAARSMVEAGRGGAIVLLSSVAGAVGSATLPTYNMSKGAVRLLAYSLAAALGPRQIRVNAVHPGVVTTAMTTIDTALAAPAEAAGIPLRRLGEPGDVANAIVYLASPLASYISGTSLFVDGGSHSSKVGRDQIPLTKTLTD